MKIISGIIVLLLMTVSLAETTTKEVRHKPNLNPGKNAMLVIIRARPFPIGGPIYNYLDGKFIGETRAKTYFFTVVKPGLHYLITEAENISIVRMNFKKGMIYYIYQDITSGFWDKNKSLSLLNSTEAQKSMSECEYIQLNKKNPGADLAPDVYTQAVKDYNIKVKKDPDYYKSFLNYQGFRP
jgi:hypothetical protein